MRQHKIHLNSEDALRQSIQALSQIQSNGEYEFTLKKLPKTRTSLQNRALHKFCRMVADALNTAGWSFWGLMLRKVSGLIWRKRREINQKAEITDYDLGYLACLGDVEEALPKVETEWNTELVKEHLWKAVQIPMLNKESTTEAERHEYGLVYEQLNRVLGTQFGIHIAWPEDEKKRRTNSG